MPSPRSSLRAVLTALVSLALAAPCGHAAAQPADTPTLTAAAGRGLQVTSADGDFAMNLRARLQARYQLVLPEEEAAERPLEQAAQISTARLWIAGHVLAPELRYTLQLAVAPRDYRDGATSPVYDAFLDWRASRDLNLKVGQLFVPFDRLRTVREWALQLTTRPQPVNELTLDRDVGVVLYSDHAFGDRSPLAWHLGLFGGGGGNVTRGKPLGGLALARLELRPLGDIDDDVEGDLDRRARPGLAIGVAGAANLNTNRARSTTGATYATPSTADYLHAAADLVFKWRGLALEAEVVTRRARQDQLRSRDGAGAELVEHTRAGWGAVGQLSWVVLHPVELVGRYSRLVADEGTDPAFAEEARRRGQELGAGANVYLNGHRFKLQLAWSALFNDAPGDGEHTVHALVDATF